MNIYKTWYAEDSTEGSLKLQEELNISAITAGLLHNRGIDNKVKAEKFLYGTLEDLTDPFLLPGMQEAVERIAAAIAGQQKIIIYGDYDVDGICSIVILKECIELLGGSAAYYVPDRFEEGYGINMPTIEKLVGQQYQLLVSVDCGITSVEEVSYATAAGMDVIITDHHTPGEILPPAVAVVNPQLGSAEDNQYLCGAGVAYYLAAALQQKMTGSFNHDQWLELAALATVADIVPLLGDNHILVRYGLQLLSITKRTGLKALLKVCALENKVLTAGQIGFVLAPRLNAAGRLDSARKSIELLLAKDQATAESLAVYMDRVNQKRREIEESIFEQAYDQILANNRQKDQVIIVAGDHWHEGVIGIVASRLGERFYRPVLVISWEGKTGKGSGRSIRGFNLHAALEYCHEYLIKFGGHPMAAGLTIARQQLDAFSAAINQYSQMTTAAEVFFNTCRTDGEIDILEITQDLMQELKTLEPFGEGNPQPRFIMRNIPIQSLRAVGSQKEHVSFDLPPANLQGIAFRKPEYKDLPYQECWHDVVGEIDENEYGGKKTLQIRIKEMKMSFIPDNIKSFQGMDHMPYRQLKLMIAEIRAGRPVVILFPTVRCLLKYKPGLEQCFRNGFLHTLHGHMRAHELTQVSTFLSRGRAGIYLMTTVCLTDLSNGSGLPKNLRYILPVWQEETMMGRKNPEHIFASIRFSMDAEQIIDSIDERAAFDHNKKYLIYSNRETTVTDIGAQIPGAISEAALANYDKRRIMRRRFSQLPAGAFITDGNYYIGEGFSHIHNIVLADLPFSMYETIFLLDQVRSDHELKIMLAAGAKQREQNCSYLSNRYPEETEINEVINYLQVTNRSTSKQDLNDLVQSIQDKLGSGITRLKVLSILQMLADSGLCEINKQGSIMEIKYDKKFLSGFNIAEALVYREGIKAKKAWQDFVHRLNIN